MREEYNTLAEENATLRKELQALKEQQQTELSVHYRDKAIYKRSPDGTEEGPFCARCWDVDRRLVHTRIVHGSWGPYLSCEQCNLQRARGR